ncbi:hypothetical protein GCM10027445_19990 [Amycolatopsis endophytica]|uniref:MFS family permease n=1 Tax=Amycolatopsis endophytica TaxID=860233 RepID=A0A853BCI4_9PSEU|nr:MFS transporter [Amycolatopsis endophytica]NYI93108.1 MFS family permease [Amycolatopsis endophytica]
MLILDVTVVAIALPNIGTDLSLSRAALTWTISAYTLTFGGLMLLGGRLADLAGAKRNRALGVWSALGGGVAALGVLLGGLLTAGPAWPWVFHVNVPLGLVIVAALARMLPRATATAPRARLDVPGAVLVTASSVALVSALITVGDQGWLTATTGWLVLAAAAGYLLFVVWQRRTRSPLMNVRLLARRPVATGTFLILVATALTIAVFFLGTFYFQHERGFGALRTGLLFLPVALVTMAGAGLTGRLIGR